MELDELRQTESRQDVLRQAELRRDEMRQAGQAESSSGGGTVGLSITGSSTDQLNESIGPGILNCTHCGKRRRLAFENGIRTRAPCNCRAPAETVQSVDADGHLLFTFGALVWCKACGKYGSAQTRGLKEQCVLRPTKGTEYRLKRLLTGRHPITNEPFTEPAKRLLA